MTLGTGVEKTYTTSRCETRIPMEVGVHISGHATLPGRETTFTENVSSRGARVLSNRRWKTNDRLILATLAGSFCSTARVTYCEGAPETGFAVGLELLDPTGDWLIASPLQ